ncbi:FAD dependent oxidoreductase [Didymella exigua CBS 183.55]|uniref:FAD dependent oxidoreductase n=1 Tax=Didymella exigua CBS 183.55 TaxID=1150837 RepID=A0A6A5S0U6_9PLEO|nr:FAD dependent oxidoreductase [Didymella exigua CBS 183.55]KAF1933094.1 FAD dependent oxidoreductase [Didymella exigua CBS 183.55]
MASPASATRTSTRATCTTSAPTPSPSPTHSPTPGPPEAHTVIIGSGIIGLSAAYFLCESGNTDPQTIWLVDSSPELLHCSSGLAAGFCAKDWFAPSVAALGALSFALHKELADAHHGRQTWGYALSTAISLSQDSESALAGSGEDWPANGTSHAQPAGRSRPSEADDGPRWLRRTEDGMMEGISRGGSTAQIDPRRFCAWLKQSVEKRGVRVLYPAVAAEVLRDTQGALSGVRVVRNRNQRTQDLPCTRLLITAGAWSPRVFATLFPAAKTRIPICALAGHSLLVRNPFFDPQEREKEKDVCHAVFATDTLGFAPELFARVGGELYLAGLNSTNIPLPDVATDAVASEKAIAQLKTCARAMLADSGAGREMEVLREGLCFRPVTPSGRPLVTRVPDERLGGVRTRGGGEGGVFIAAGHGAWGISQGPGTGLVLAELMEGRPTSANIDALRLPS